ncbi:MAG: aminotransferase class III-fold pyridoxal phosphate-dependent enzyme [Spirochaetales bacterium]|nr:MAG: aminotransferase class III-fold pyridoxal phosphate-dependent enzyme [Spirochaetales bacterium]
MNPLRAPAEPDPRFEKSVQLFRRATAVIPGGIYGSKSPGFVVPGSYPYFFDRGHGCRLYDVDGNEFIDYMCGYGSQILGYGYEPVLKAGYARLADGDLLTSASPVMVELAETLTQRIDRADWAVFTKNGTDATTLAVSLARVATDKPVILMARGAYHGAANWCSSNEYPVLEDRKHVVEFTYNDTRELSALFATHAGRIAAVIVTPYHHPTFGASRMPDPQWYPAIHRLCDAERALLIMDDIRANFRINAAGSHVEFGASPDLICMGKSIANGSPLGVLLGTESLKKIAASFFISGTFWTAGGPMAMALACLEAMDQHNVLQHLRAMGSLLGDGLVESARESGFAVTVSGPPTIPFMTFDEDPDLFMNQTFCAAMSLRGIYLHPHHNWFISYAHKEPDIRQTLEMARTTFREMAARLG